MVISLRALILGLILAVVIGCWFLPLASGYAVFLVPVSLVREVGPSWYFGLISLIAGSIVGVVSGGFGCTLLSHPRPAWIIISATLPAAVYLAFAVYAGWGFSGPGWWTPVADALSFVAAFIGTGVLVARRKRAHAV